MYYPKTFEEAKEKLKNDRGEGLRIEIVKRYTEARITINKVIKARLGDGYFVYHDKAFPETKRIKRRELIKKGSDFKRYKVITEHQILRRDFVDSRESINIHIVEAKNR